MNNRIDSWLNCSICLVSKCCTVIYLTHFVQILGYHAVPLANKSLNQFTHKKCKDPQIIIPVKLVKRKNPQPANICFWMHKRKKLQVAISSPFVVICIGEVLSSQISRRPCSSQWNKLHVSYSVRSFNARSELFMQSSACSGLIKIIKQGRYWHNVMFNYSNFSVIFNNLFDLSTI